MRLENRGRYDDRLIARTNLMEAHEQLEAFCRKYLPDPFYLEGTQRVSARDVCASTSRRTASSSPCSPAMFP